MESQFEETEVAVDGMAMSGANVMSGATVNSPLFSSSSTSTSSGATRRPEVREILRDLHTLTHLRENDRVNTRTNGTRISRPFEPFLWLRRFLWGESREQNLVDVGSLFNRALNCIDEALQERERMQERMQRLPPECISRADVVAKLQNQQLIDNLARAITQTKDKVFRSLKTTYDLDAQTLSKIECLNQEIDDRLQQIEVSLQFLRSERPPTPDNETQ